MSGSHLSGARAPSLPWRRDLILLGILVLGILVAGPAPASAQIGIQQRNFNEQTLRERGAPVYPVYEGWYRAEDGSRRLCWGYLNANTVESVEIPLGPDNFVEPAGFDGSQPSHFRPVPARNYRRDYCVFTVVWPETNGPDDRIVWTLSSHGEPLSAPGHVMPSYELDDRSSAGRGDVAPVMTLGRGGPVATGRTGATVELRATVGQPLELAVHVQHPRPQSYVLWAKHQGPGSVIFGSAELRVAASDGWGVTTVTFGQPGEYVLRAQSINSLGSFDFYCCWTNGYFHITVVE